MNSKVFKNFNELKNTSQSLQINMESLFKYSSNSQTDRKSSTDVSFSMAGIARCSKLPPLLSNYVKFLLFWQTNGGQIQTTALNMSTTIPRVMVYCYSQKKWSATKRKSFQASITENFASINRPFLVVFSSFFVFDL